MEDYVAPRFIKKKAKSKLRHKILEGHANVKDLNLVEAKMNFIRAWQSLPEFGVSLFVVKFHGERREELLGIASNRVMRMGIVNGEHLTTWRYNTVKVREKSVDHNNNDLSYLRHGTSTGRPAT